MKENEEFNESMLIQTSKKYVLCQVKFILRFFSFIKNKRMSIISFKKNKIKRKKNNPKDFKKALYSDRLYFDK